MGLGDGIGLAFHHPLLKVSRRRWNNAGKPGWFLDLRRPGRRDPAPIARSAL
jgi:hypothetical protein